MNQKNILFLCTGNACRSQMAEGICRALKADTYNAYSAGIQKHGLNPRAVTVLAEIGIDISNNISKTVDDLSHIHFDEVITVCAHADQHCPSFTGSARVTHIGFDDPPKLAENAKTEQEALDHFRRIRDQIKLAIQNLS